MKSANRSALRAVLVMTLVGVIALASTHLRADTGVCGGASITLPFTDVSSSNIFFCSIATAYFTGLTNGTTPTTFSPGDLVPREQMAAFVTRTMDQSLKRGSRRAALDQYWIPLSAADVGLTIVGSQPQLVKSDGADLWVANYASSTVSRVRASDGSLLQTWTGAASAISVLSTKGQIFVAGNTSPGSLYQIDPTQTAGATSLLTAALGNLPRGIAFDGSRIWTANEGASISIVTLNPLNVTNVTTGTILFGIVFDGSNMWTTDFGSDKLYKLDSNGTIIQTVTVGTSPAFLIFDGTNLWVPNFNSNTVTVVRASTGAVLATLTGNGLNGPHAVAFDGERIMVANLSGNSVSLWKASDLTPAGSISAGVGTTPVGVCSDGLNFWVTLRDTNKLARF